MSISRKTNCRKIYENHLADDKSEYVVTLDEALVYKVDANGQTQICYITREESVPDHWVFEKGETFTKSFMVIGIIADKVMSRVPSSAYINAQYYVDYVLKSLFTVQNG